MIYMGIFFPSRNTRARPCLRGSHGQTPDKPVCMIYVSEYLPGVFKSSQHPLERGIDHVSPLLPSSDSTTRVTSSASLSCWLPATAESGGSVWETLCHLPVPSFFFFFFTLRQWTDVQLRFVDIKKTESRCQFVSLLRSSDSKKCKIKCRNFLPLRKTSSSAMCFDISVKTRCTAQRRGPLSSRVPQIINLNLSKQSLSSRPASPSSLCCSYALPLVFLREQRVELNHYFLKEIITSNQWSDALPAP